MSKYTVEIHCELTAKSPSRDKINEKAKKALEDLGIIHDLELAISPVKKEKETEEPAEINIVKPVKNKLPKIKGKRGRPPKNKK